MKLLALRSRFGFAAAVDDVAGGMEWND